MRGVHQLPCLYGRSLSALAERAHQARNAAFLAEFRHAHITNVIRGLGEHLEHYRNTSVGRVQAAGEVGTGVDWKDLKNAVKDLPEYRAMMAKNEQPKAATARLGRGH